MKRSYLVMQFEKKTLLFFQQKKNTFVFLKKNVFYGEKNMTSEKNTEKCFFFIIKYVLKKNKLSLVCYKNDITQNALFFRGSF